MDTSQQSPLYVKHIKHSNRKFTFKKTIIHPSTVPIPNVKIKRVLKVYHVMHKNLSVKSTMSKFQCTMESMINTRSLLYFFHMTTYNQINGKRQRVPVIHFYILVRFQIRIHFRTSLYIRVSGSVQTVKCAIKYHTINPCHKLHYYIPSFYTFHNTLLYKPKIIYTKTFLYYTVICQSLS